MYSLRVALWQIAKFRFNYAIKITHKEKLLVLPSLNFSIIPMKTSVDKGANRNR